MKSIIVYPNTFTYDLPIAVIQEDGQITATGSCTMDTMNESIVQYCQEADTNNVVFACENKKFGNQLVEDFLTFTKAKYSEKIYTVEVI